MKLAVQQKKWESEREGGEMAEWEEEEANSQLEEADEGLMGGRGSKLTAGGGR